MIAPSDSQMTSFSTNILPDGVCIIYLNSQLLPAHASAIVRTIQTHISQGQVCGLMLDVRDAALLSIVRLASLLDMLSAQHLPLAVLFGSPTQYQLAGLLHNTLVNKARVAYFLDYEDAHAFLMRAQHPPSNLS